MTANVIFSTQFKRWAHCIVWWICDYNNYHVSCHNAIRTVQLQVLQFAIKVSGDEGREKHQKPSSDWTFFLWEASVGVRGRRGWRERGAGGRHKRHRTRKMTSRQRGDWLRNNDNRNDTDEREIRGRGDVSSGERHKDQGRGRVGYRREIMSTEGKKKDIKQLRGEETHAAGRLWLSTVCALQRKYAAGKKKNPFNNHSEINVVEK